MGGYRPPPPSAGAPAAVPQRTIAVRTQGTAGDTDPLAAENAALPKGKTRADFRPEEFKRTILQHGSRIVWRKAMLCPCVREESDQVDLACDICDSSGFFYVDPLEIQALMLAFDKSTRMYEKFGLWEAGSVAVTTEAAHRLGWRDSLEMVDAIMNFNELIRKGNRRGRRRALPAGTDITRYRIAKLTKALVKTSAGIVPLEAGIDFDINGAGHIVWTPTGNAKVPDDTWISVHYDFHPVWIVMSHPHVIRTDLNGFKRSPEEVIDLPVQCSAQLDFLTESEQQLPVTGDC